MHQNAKPLREVAQAAILWPIWLRIGLLDIQMRYRRSALGVGYIFINLAVMVSYEKALKSSGIAGNLEISYLIASLFVFGAVSAGNVGTVIVYFAAMAFLANFMREIAKDIQDMDGDRGVRNTAPLAHGVGAASALASFSLLAAVFLSPVPYLVHITTVYYLAIVLAADAIFIYSIFLLGRRMAKGSQTCAKLGMLLSLLAFAIGVVA